jgi:Mg2+/Co2+ transporter CorC
MVLGVTDAKGHPSTISDTSFQDLVKKAREGSHDIPVKLVGDLGMKDPFITLPESESLTRVVEIMASGVHRIAVTRENSNHDVIGVLSQRKILKFFWDNVRAFTDLEQLYQKSVTSSPKTETYGRLESWESGPQTSFPSTLTAMSLLLSK